MAIIATGVYKTLSVKKQSAKGVKAPAGAAGSARYQRRVTSTLNYTRPNFGSAEIRKSQQQADGRLGTVAVNGSLNQELSVGGHQVFMEAVLRAASSAVYNSGALAIVAAAVLTDTRTMTLTRSGGDWGATAKFKVGDVVDVTGFTAPATANNTRAAIMALTATVMTLAALDEDTVFVTKVAGDNVTVTLAGKFIAVPTSGHTRDYLTVEEFHADIAEGETFVDVVPTALNFGMTPNGMVTLEVPCLGLDMDTAQAEYFTSPAAEPTGAVLSSAVGMLLIDGVLYGTITSFTANVNGNHTVPGGVAFSKVDPDVFPGIITGGAQMSVLLQNMTLRDKFKGEQHGVVTIVLHDAASSTAPNFFAMTFPKSMFTSHTKDDGQGGITASVGVMAKENLQGSANGTSRPTLVSVQDSGFA